MLGAEDYITKPFSVAELLARVKAVLRRDAIARGGTLVELTATEFDVLLWLSEASGRVLSREQIQAEVWGPTHHGTPRTVDNFIIAASI